MNRKSCKKQFLTGSLMQLTTNPLILFVHNTNAGIRLFVNMLSP